MRAFKLNHEEFHLQYLLVIVCGRNSVLNLSLFNGVQVSSIMLSCETFAYYQFHSINLGYMFFLSPTHSTHSLFLDFMQSFRLIDFISRRYTRIFYIFAFLLPTCSKFLRAIWLLKSLSVISKSRL